MGIIPTVIVMFFILLTFWRRDIFLYLMTAPVVLTFGLMWRPAYPTPDGMVISLALIGTGLYCFIMGIFNIVRIARR